MALARRNDADSTFCTARRCNNARDILLGALSHLERFSFAWSEPIPDLWCSPPEFTAPPFVLLCFSLRSCLPYTGSKVALALDSSHIFLQWALSIRFCIYIDRLNIPILFKSLIVMPVMSLTRSLIECTRSCVWRFIPFSRVCNAIPLCKTRRIRDR